MKKKILIIIYLTVLIPFWVLSQSPPSYNSSTTNLNSILDSSKNNKLFYFNFEYSKNTDSFFIDYKAHFGFGSIDNFAVSRKSIDEYGITHTYYKQYYNQIEILGSDLHLQTKSGSKSILNGTLYPIDSLDLSNLIADSQAINTAIGSFATNTAYNSESDIRPAPITIKKVAIYIGQSFIVAYVVNLDVENDKYSNIDVYINAKTGSIIAKRNVTRSNSNGCTLHYGNQNFRTLDSTKLTHFGCRPRGHNYLGRNIFLDTSRNIDFWTYYTQIRWDTFKDVNGIIQNTIVRNNYVFNVPSSPLTNIGCTGSDNLLKSGIEAHWLIDKFIDMVQVKYKHKLDSTQLNTGFVCNHDPDVTNSNKKFFNIVLSDNPSTINNAFASGSSIVFGRRVTNYELEKKDPPVFLLNADVAGHEMGHFMTRNLRGGSGLTYERESGAIEEGIADIMGSLLERYISNGFNANKTPNWILSEDCNGLPTYDFINGSKGFPYVRNMAYPQEKNMPNYIGSPYWKIPAPSCCTLSNETDNCWVHHNSSILAKWFQLLVDGGTNQGSPYQYNVPAMQIDSLVKLFLYTVRYSINDDVTFQDFYNLSLANCNTLFPASVRASYVNSIKLAWWSVGVGNPSRARTTYIISANAELTSLDHIRDPMVGTPNNYVVSHKDFILLGDFKISQGKTLTCKDCNFYVRNNGAIIFKENSKGKFDSCLFTSRDTTPIVSCTTSAQSLWKGIQMYPYGTMCIDNIAINPSIELKNSQIEYATVGVISGSQYICDHQPSAPSPANGWRNQYGGNVTINNSKFINNIRDVVYGRSDFQDYNLTITNSSFIYNDFASVQKTKCIFVTGNYNPILREELNDQKNYSINTKNYNPIVIDNCIFSTLFEYSFPTIPVTGVELLLSLNNQVRDMSIVSISNSVFRGFKTDIKAKGLSEFVCRKNDFRNSETGVEVTHSTNAYILSNNFTRTNYSIDLRNSVLDDNSNHSIGNNIDTNKFYYLFDGMSQYENKKEVYLSNTRNTSLMENYVFSQIHSGSFSDPAYVAFHIVGTDNTRVKNNFFDKEVCQGVDGNWNLDNNCLSMKHEVPVVWERHDNNSGYFVNNTISNWWTRGIHTRYHNRNVRIKCNDLFPTKAPDHTAIFIDSGELKNQGEYSSLPANSCNQNNGIYPAANRFLYRSNGLAVNDNCTYPTLIQQTQQGISSASRQVAIRPHNLPSGYVWRYYTQQRDLSNVFTPKTDCYSLSSFISVSNCPNGSPGYTIQPNTCDESNLYLIKKPEGGLGSGTPCEYISVWKDHRVSLIQQLQSEPVICADNSATQLRFEILDASFRKYLDIVDADDYIFNYVDTCDDFNLYESEIINSDIAISKYTLAERYIQRNQLSNASSLITNLNTTVPFESSILCDARLDHFNDEHPRYMKVLELELKQAQRANQGDTTKLSSQELAQLYTIRDQSLGKAAIKAEKLIEEYASDKLYRRVPGFSVQTTSTPVVVDTGILLPLTIFPNPNSGQFEVAFEYNQPYSQAQILIFKLTQPTQPVFSKTLTSYPPYIQESVQLNQAQAGLYTDILYINNQAKAGATVQISY